MRPEVSCFNLEWTMPLNVATMTSTMITVVSVTEFELFLNQTALDYMCAQAHTTTVFTIIQ